jgi:hypothetical protein
VLAERGSEDGQQQPLAVADRELAL